MPSFTYCCNMADADVFGLTITESLTLDLLVREMLDAAKYGTYSDYEVRRTILTVVAIAYGMPYLKVTTSGCLHVVLSSMPIADDIDDDDDDDDLYGYDDEQDEGDLLDLDDESLAWFNRYVREPVVAPHVPNTLP